MPSYTVNYNLPKPFVADAIDEDLWGGYLNDALDIIDTTMKANADSVAGIGPALSRLSDGLNMNWVSSSSYSIPALTAFSDTGISIPLSTLLTKTTAVFAAGNNNGSLDAGTITASKFYYVFLIRDVTNALTDGLLSLSRTSPTLPTNYTQKRYIGCVRTDASGNILKFYQNGDNFFYDVPQNLINQSVAGVAVDFTTFAPPNTIANLSLNVNVLSASGQLYVNVQRKGSGGSIGEGIASSVGYSRSTSGDDISPSGQIYVAVDGNSAVTVYRTASTGTGLVYMATRGWIDSRSV